MDNLKIKGKFRGAVNVCGGLNLENKPIKYNALVEIELSPPTPEEILNLKERDEALIKVKVMKKGQELFDYIKNSFLSDVYAIFPQQDCPYCGLPMKVHIEPCILPQPKKIEELKLNDIYGFNPSPEINAILVTRTHDSVGVIIDKLNECCRAINSLRGLNGS